MKQKFLTFLYKRYKREFDTIAIQDTVAQIPVKLTPPNSDFLMRSGEQFEKFLLYEAYLAHRQNMNKPGNGLFYDGWIGHIRFLLRLCNKFVEPPPPLNVPTVENKPDPMEGVKAFAKGMKKG